MGNVWISAPELDGAAQYCRLFRLVTLQKSGRSRFFPGGSGQPGISQSKVSGESGDKVYKLNELGEPSWEVVNRQKPITGSTGPAALIRCRDAKALPHRTGAGSLKTLNNQSDGEWRVAGRRN